MASMFVLVCVCWRKRGRKEGGKEGRADEERERARRGGEKEREGE